jgi:signal transduction histidine kinase
MIEDVIKRPPSDVSQADIIEKLQASPSQVNNRAGVDEFERLARETKEITTLYNLAVAVGSTLNLNQVIWRLYKESSQIIDTSNFALALYNKNTNVLNCSLIVHQGKPVKSFSIKVANNQGLLTHLLTRQAPLLIQDLTKINGRIEIEKIYPAKKLRAWLGVPILNPALPDQGVQGVITIWSDKPNAFTQHDVWLLSAIGTQAAIAIRNAQLYEATQRRIREMNLLHEMSQRRATEMALLNDIARTLSSTLQFKKVLTRTTEGVNKLFKVEVGFLFLIDALTGDLMFQRALGEKAKEIKPFRIPRGKDVAGRVALTSKPLLLREADLNKHRLNELEQLLNLSIRTLLCVPLISHEQVIGVLEVINNQEGDFTQNHLELLSSIASYAAIAIENARLHQNVLDKRDRVIEAEEEARKDLARDLHDGPTQLISSVMMRLDFCKMLVEREPAKLPHEIATTQKLAEQAIHEIRTLLFEMRPLILETQGLGEALKIFMERRQNEVEGKTRLTLDIKSSNANGDVTRQDTKVEAAIFAIVQEAVNNALKHAEAQNIAVQVKETATAIYVIVKDDGMGFDMDQVMSNYRERESWGMANIRERTQLLGAELTMKSTPGEGTHITIYVPKAKEERLKKRGTGPLSLPLDML